MHRGKHYNKVTTVASCRPPCIPNNSHCSGILALVPPAPIQTNERKPDLAQSAISPGADTPVRSKLGGERDEIISLVKRRSYIAAEARLVSQCQAGVFEVMLWNRLMSEFKRGDGTWKDILRLLRRMDQLGCPPDVVSFNILIDS